MTNIYNIDDIIEGNYKSLGKWLNGKISAISENGTYVINYNDGEVEDGVNADHLRIFNAGTINDNLGTSLTEGMKVEGNYRGRGKWFPCKISRVRGDGTYDIAYDDGETETRLDKELVRVLGSEIINSDNTSAPVAGLVEGMKVEGNYRGRGKWYPGKISAVNDNGTYNIAYDDGENESGLDKELVRVNGSVQFQVEDTVDGNYRGRGTWYKGKISKIENSGIYEIKYDDGEVERGVSADFIRLFPDFPTWSLDGIVGPIVMNGVPIDTILGKIGEQIALLKDRSNEAKQSSISFNNKLNLDEKSINDLTVDMKALKEQFNTVSLSNNSAPEQPPIVQASSGSDIDSALLDQQFSAFNQKLITMTGKMETYEKSLSAAKEENAIKNKKIEQLEEMIQKLTLKATNNEKTIESNKSNHNKDLNETSQQLSNKITELINMVNTKGNADAKFEDYDNKFKVMSKKLDEMESKMNLMNDSNRAVESRVKQFETLFNQLLEQIAAAKENIDSLGARVEYELTDRLNRLDRGNTNNIT